MGNYWNLGCNNCCNQESNSECGLQNNSCNKCGHCHCQCKCCCKQNECGSQGSSNTYETCGSYFSNCDKGNW